MPPSPVAVSTSTAGSGVVAAPRPPAGPRVSACWFRRERWLPLALVVVVFLGPVLGADPTHSRGARVLLGLLTGLTLLAALIKHYSTVRLGMAVTAIIGASALPWQLAWWPLPGLAGVATYLAAGALPAAGGRRAAGTDVAAR